MCYISLTSSVPQKLYSLHRIDAKDEKKQENLASNKLIGGSNFHLEGITKVMSRPNSTVLLPIDAASPTVSLEINLSFVRKRKAD